jgi:hypothetical protein
MLSMRGSRARSFFFVSLVAAITGLVALPGVAPSASIAEAQAQRDTQDVLGPGLYVFQTRLDHSSCGDSGASGSVTSYFAAVDGIPGSRQMTMHLLNSDHWSTWTLTVTAENQIIGDAQQDGVTGPGRGDSHFELSQDRGKFTGRGSRSYSATIGGQVRRCRMAYDALLRRLHE